ncbi:vitamin K epoxide reductase family protein [bacterium]|nr:vitamin K epoxide reductase family protein [bacterium]
MKDVSTIIYGVMPAFSYIVKNVFHNVATFVFRVLCFSLILGYLLPLNGVAASKTTLKAVLFYKTDCQECETAIQNILPKYVKKLDSKLKILAINNSISEGASVFLDTLLTLNIPAYSQLPILIIGSHILTGLDDINQNLPGVLSAPSDATVYDWPQVSSINSLVKKIQQMESVPSAKWIDGNTEQGFSETVNTFKYNFKKDIVGNSIALIVLIGMLMAVVFGIILFVKRPMTESCSISVAYPILGITALSIAGYLFYSGVVESELMCGPVGECNTVQQSKYAMLFNVIPVSLLGIVNYCVGLICWIQSKLANKTLNAYFVILGWGTSVCGVGFFIYLTFLEPFIIGASCAWCLTAATLTTLQTLTATPPARVALNKVF